MELQQQQMILTVKQNEIYGKRALDGKTKQRSIKEILNEKGIVMLGNHYKQIWGAALSKEKYEELFGKEASCDLTSSEFYKTSWAYLRELTQKHKVIAITDTRFSKSVVLRYLVDKGTLQEKMKIVIEA